MAKKPAGYATNRATGTTKPTSTASKDAYVDGSGRIVLSTGVIIDPSTPDGQAILWNAGQAAQNPNYKPDSFDSQALVGYVGSLPAAERQRVTGYDPGSPDSGISGLSEGARAYQTDAADQHLTPGAWAPMPTLATSSAGNAEAQAGQYYNQGYQTQLGAFDQTDGQIQGLQGLNGWLTGSQNELIQGNRDLIAQQGGYNDQYVGAQQGLVDQLGGLNNGANAYDWGNLGTYQGQIAGTNASNSAALGSYQQTAQGLLQPMQSGVSWGGDLTSQAAIADPTALAAQNNALGAFSAGMGGAYSYASQAATAQADPYAVQMQSQALSQLAGAASGSLDAQSQAAQAYADQNAINAQYNASAQLGMTANGALNQVSQAAKAAADSRDIIAQSNTAGQLTQMGLGSTNIDTDRLAGYGGLLDSAQGGNNIRLQTIPGFNELQQSMYGSADVNFTQLNGIDDLYSAYQGDQDINFDQLQGVSDLKNTYQGGNDIDFDQLQGVSDLYGASKGSKDVHVGQEDPGAYAALTDARDKYKDLTTPEVTSAERFIYEQARGQQEQDDRSNRAATMTNLRQRGMSGSGQELTQAALAGQQTSQNRLLSDLGAQANAVQRSMQALGGYADTSSAMNQQANTLAAQNQQTQLAALGQYAGLSANVAGMNKEMQQNALNQYSGLAANVAGQNQGVRMNALGQFTDIAQNVAQNNMDRRFNAMGQVTGIGLNAAQFNSSLMTNASNSLANLDAGVKTGNAERQIQATSLANQAYAQARSQGFDEDFSRKAAADSMAQFNSNLQFQGQQAYYGSTSDIRQQSFGENYARGQAADSMTNANMDRRLTGMQAEGNLASTARSQSFNESYSRGQAADQASEYNNTMKYNSAVSYGNQANAMQDDAYARGQATDQTNQFNRLQSIGVDEYNATYNQTDAIRRQGVNNDLLSNTTKTNQQNLDNDTLGYEAGRDTNATTLGRSVSTLGAQSTLNGQKLGLQQGQTQLGIGANNQQIGANLDFWGRTGGTTGLGIQSTQGRAAATTDYYRDMAGLSMGDAQAAAAQKAAKAQGTPGPLSLWTTYDDDAGHGSGLSIGG